MISLLENIYKQNKFETEDNRNNLLFSFKDNQEYYITVEYTANEIKDFFENEKTNNIIKFFKEIKSYKSDIQKNTSLIISVNVDNIEDGYNELKKSILKIEEDEYFFRKYVIMYTDKGVENIDCSKNIKYQLQEIISENNGIEEYQKNFYFNEEFFVAVQLFIKLPFLVFETDTKPFEPIEGMIEDRLMANQLKSVYDKIIGLEKTLEENYNVESLDELMEEFLTEKEENAILSEFFKYFEEI